MRALLGCRRHHPAWRRLTLTGVGTVLALMPIGYECRGLGTATLLAGYVNRPSVIFLFGSGTLTTPNPTSKAITYDADLAPIGAAMTATVTPSSGDATTAEITVSGLLSNRGYPVYAHTRACGMSPDAAGPRFENRDPEAAPAQRSRNSQYADLSHEIALIVRTDTAGAGTSRTTVPFVLTDRTPGSIVMQEMTRTSTSSGHEGESDNPIACLTLSRR